MSRSRTAREPQPTAREPQPSARKCFMAPRNWVIKAMLLLQMAQETTFTSLGELLEETGDTEADSKILERIKLLAQELLPEGWPSWKVTRLSRDEVFGTPIDPQVLNKLRFALPTDELARAFDPETVRLSEKGFRDLKVKMLDWAFARALITSPPSICNRIRGSAAATEIFNQAVKSGMAMSRREADRALSLDRDSEGDVSRKRRSSTFHGPNPKKSKVEMLEQRMESMFSTIMDRISSLEPSNRKSKYLVSSDEGDTSNDTIDFEPHSRSRSTTPDDWHAPSVEHDLQVKEAEPPLLPELDFLPEVKEIEPEVPAPTEQVRKEGIACQRFGSEAWNRIRYKEVAKRLHAAPVFSALKVNTELVSLGVQPSGLLAKQDNVLGTIVHGLLCQRKELAEDLRQLAKKFPNASQDLRKLLSDGSGFKSTSDDLLQFVCAHRAETIEMRRKAFRTKNEALSSVLHHIPPSPTHLFDEQELSNFIKDQGGAGRIFLPKLVGKQSSFRQIKQVSRSAAPSSSTIGQLRTKQPVWRSRPDQATRQRKQGRPGGHGRGRREPERSAQRQKQRRKY